MLFLHTTNFYLQLMRIFKNTDIKLFINEKFDIIIKDKNNKHYIYPTILETKKTLIVPKHLKTINSFLNKQIKMLSGKNVDIFLSLVNLNLTPFIWNLMKDANIDLYLSKGHIFVRNNDKYIILNSKNINQYTILKLYKAQGKTHVHSIYEESLQELHNFIRQKISNSIGHNQFVNSQIKNYELTEKNLELEFTNKQYNFPKILFLYEKLIRMKENYLNENHFLVPEEEIEKQYQILQKIRELINQ